MFKELILALLAGLVVVQNQIGVDLRQWQDLLNPITEESVKIAANQNVKSIVKIRGYRQFRNRLIAASEGTGFVISADGSILTNKHVVNGNRIVYKVTTGEGTTYDVTNVTMHPDNDIAVIKVDGGQHPHKELIPIALGDSTKLKSGEPVAALGNDPGKISPTLLTGRVLAVDDTIVSGRRYQREVLNDVIKTNLSLVSGNSGSPLLDDSGHVVGINTAVSRIGDTSFAIPINEAKDFLNSVNR